MTGQKGDASWEIGGFPIQRKEQWLLYGKEFAFSASVDEGTVIGGDAAGHGVLLFIQSFFLPRL